MAKLRIINVVEIKQGVVHEITSFGLTPRFALEASQKEWENQVVAEAEKLFEEKCRLYGYDEDDNASIEDLLDDGVFEGGNFSICLTWTEITL
jgi:hypothetical protein